MRYQVIVLATLLASSVLLGRIARAQDASADLEPMQLNRLLRIPSVKAALKLTPEQAASIQEIQGSMQEKMRQLFSEARREAGQTPDAERRREIVDKVRTTAAEFDEQLRKTLKPEQVARLRQVQLQVGVRRQIVELLTSPPIAAQLELSKAQGKDLRGLRQGPELRKQALELLTEAQREKLNELLGDPVDLPERLLSSRSFLSGGPAPDREAAARRSFQVFDRDGDGKITREEAERVRVGPTRDRSRIAQEFDTYDADSNGSVSLAEFTRQFGTRRPRPRAPERDREATAERIFKQLDADGDGQITREEANATRTPLARDFESFDANSDGNVTLEEFKRRFGGAVNANQAFERSFRSLDGDNDGKITRDEASKRPQSRIVEEFDSFDADSDGSVTLAEFKQQQFERAMASTSAVRAELIAQLESRYWPQRPRRQVTGEGDTLDSESLPGEGVWLDPALRRPNAPRFRVTVWFDRQFLGDGNAYTRRCQEFADQPRRQLRTRVIHTLKTLSDESYRAAKDELGKLVDDGQIDLVEWHWIVNGFSCVATNEGLAGLQKVPGVKKIFLARGRLASPPDTDDREPYFSPPAESRPPEPEGWKLPWYTRYLQADKVWKRLGVSGAGTLHVVMDGNFVSVLSWYDNEWGFSNRMADTAVALGKTL